jgi:hypothetical protein
MTSIFGVLSTEGILQTEELTKATTQNKEQDAIAQSKREKKDDNMDDFHYKACPICNDNKIE